MKSVRDIFNNVLNFEPYKRTLKWELGYWAGTVERWYSEGLIKNKGYNVNLKSGDTVLGPGNPFRSTRPSGINPEIECDINNFFNFDREWSVAPYNYWLFPGFEKKTIYEDEQYIEYIDADGVIKKELKSKTSMPMFLEFPVKDRNDWEQIKEERFNFDSIDKRFEVNEKKYIEKIKNRTIPIGVLGYPTGFFGSVRWLIGDKNLFMLYYDDPGLIKDILNHFCKLWLLMCEKLTSKIDFDFAVFWEDMSGRQGSMISPATFREFMSPNYKKLTAFLKSRGINIFAVDTDGYVGELINLFLETGINMLFPFEQQADNDLIKFRKKFPELRMFGGIDKKILSRDKKSIDKELEKISFLIRQGGYIPSIDHNVAPDSSWENFKYYRNRLNEIIDSTKVLF